MASAPEQDDPDSASPPFPRDNTDTNNNTNNQRKLDHLYSLPRQPAPVAKKPSLFKRLSLFRALARVGKRSHLIAFALHIASAESAPRGSLNDRLLRVRVRKGARGDYTAAVAVKEDVARVDETMKMECTMFESGGGGQYMPKHCSVGVYKVTERGEKLIGHLRIDLSRLLDETRSLETQIAEAEASAVPLWITGTTLSLGTKGNTSMDLQVRFGFWVNKHHRRIRPPDAPFPKRVSATQQLNIPPNNNNSNNNTRDSSPAPPLPPIKTSSSPTHTQPTSPKHIEDVSSSPRTPTLFPLPSEAQNVDDVVVGKEEEEGTAWVAVDDDDEDINEELHDFSVATPSYRVETQQQQQQQHVEVIEDEAIAWSVSPAASDTQREENPFHFTSPSPSHRPPHAHTNDNDNTNASNIDIIPSPPLSWRDNGENESAVQYTKRMRIMDEEVGSPAWSGSAEESLPPIERGDSPSSRYVGWDVSSSPNNNSVLALSSSSPEQRKRRVDSVVFDDEVRGERGIVRYGSEGARERGGEGNNNIVELALYEMRGEDDDQQQRSMQRLHPKATQPRGSLLEELESASLASAFGLDPGADMDPTYSDDIIPMFHLARGEDTSLPAGLTMGVLSQEARVHALKTLHNMSTLPSMSQSRGQIEHNSSSHNANTKPGPWGVLPLGGPNMLPNVDPNSLALSGRNNATTMLSELPHLPASLGVEDGFVPFAELGEYRGVDPSELVLHVSAPVLIGDARGLDVLDVMHHLVSGGNARGMALPPNSAWADLAHAHAYSTSSTLPTLGGSHSNFALPHGHARALPASISASGALVRAGSAPISMPSGVDFAAAGMGRLEISSASSAMAAAISQGKALPSGFREIARVEMRGGDSYTGNSGSVGGNAYTLSELGRVALHAVKAMAMDAIVIQAAAAAEKGAFALDGSGFNALGYGGGDSSNALVRSNSGHGGRNNNRRTLALEGVSSGGTITLPDGTVATLVIPPQHNNKHNSLFLPYNNDNNNNMLALSRSHSGALAMTSSRRDNNNNNNIHATTGMVTYRDKSGALQRVDPRGVSKDSQLGAALAIAVSMEEWSMLEAWERSEQHDRPAGVSQQGLSVLGNFDNSNNDGATITLAMLVQLRDPKRDNLAVGAPMLAMVTAEKLPSSSKKKKTSVGRSSGKRYLTGGQRLLTHAKEGLDVGDGEEVEDVLEDEAAEQEGASGLHEEEEEEEEEEPKYKITGVHLVGMYQDPASVARQRAARDRQFGARKSNTNWSFNRRSVPTASRHGGAASAWGASSHDPFRRRTATVREGDTMWGIAQRTLGDGQRWREVAEKNPQIHNPDLIRPKDNIRVK